MASSRHSVMQCSSLPQSSGRGNAVIPPSISRHFTPQTSTHRLQPVQLLASTTGIHLNLMSWSILGELLDWALLHDDRALHPWMWGTLEMHDAFLVKLLRERGTESQHGRSELAFLTEHAVRHPNIGVLERHGLTCLDRDGLRAEGLHRTFPPNARARQHFDRDAVCRLHYWCRSRHSRMHF